MPKADYGSEPAPRPSRTWLQSLVPILPLEGERLKEDDLRADEARAAHCRSWSGAQRAAVADCLLMTTRSRNGVQVCRPVRQWSAMFCLTNTSYALYCQ